MPRHGCGESIGDADVRGKGIKACAVHNHRMRRLGMGRNVSMSKRADDRNDKNSMGITAGCDSHAVLIIPVICSFAHAHVSSHTQPAHPVVMHCACLYSLSSHICVTDALSAPMPRHAALRSMRATLNCFYYSRFCSAFQDRNRVFSDYVGDIA